MFIGNDIVALKSTQKPHPRFDARVFNANELKQIQAIGDTMRWFLWAAKEACYKLEKQRNPALFFSPIEYEWCQNEGHIKFRGRRIKINFSLDRESNYVHAWCFERDLINVSVQVENIFALTQSKAVRQLAQELIFNSIRFKEWVKTSKMDDQNSICEIKFEQTQTKVPKAFFLETEVPVALSFSHDENYVAVAIGWLPSK